MPTKRLKTRESYLLRTYGITLAQYSSLLKKQNGCCAVCDRPESSFTKKLAVDHDHVEKFIRGLLCSYCNHRLVGRHRDPVLLRRIADYISQNTGWRVPDKKKRKRRK